MQAQKDTWSKLYQDSFLEVLGMLCGLVLLCAFLSLFVGLFPYVLSFVTVINLIVLGGLILVVSLLLALINVHFKQQDMRKKRRIIVSPVTLQQPTLLQPAPIPTMKTPFTNSIGQKVTKSPEYQALQEKRKQLDAAYEKAEALIIKLIGAGDSEEEAIRKGRELINSLVPYDSSSDAGLKLHRTLTLSLLSAVAHEEKQKYQKEVQERLESERRKQEGFEQAKQYIISAIQSQTDDRTLEAIAAHSFPSDISALLTNEEVQEWHRKLRTLAHETRKEEVKRQYEADKQAGLDARYIEMTRSTLQIIGPPGFVKSVNEFLNELREKVPFRYEQAVKSFKKVEFVPWGALLPDGGKADHFSGRSDGYFTIDGTTRELKEHYQPNTPERFKKVFLHRQGKECGGAAAAQRSSNEER